jgi:hypothetical protein
MKIITIGSNPGNNVVINDPLIDGRHCQIIQDDYGNFSLVDNNSASGTFVNDQRRDGQSYLNPSDIVKIGNTILPWTSYFSNSYSPASSGGGGYPPPKAMPPTYLWQAIVVTILCCIPFGIPAIVYASRVEKLFILGDYAGAERASSNAKTWALVALIIGAVGVIIYIIYAAVVGAAMFGRIHHW